MYKKNNWINAGKFILNLAKIAISENYLADAEIKISEVNQLIKTYHLNDLELKVAYFEQSSAFFFKQKKFETAFIYQDSFMQFKDSLTKQRDASMISNIEAQLMTEKHLSDLALLEKEKRVQQLTKNFIIVVSGLIVLFLTVFIYHLRQRQKRKQKIMELEKDKTDAELHIAKKELHSFMSGLRKKNKLIEQFKDEITQLKKNLTPEVISEREQTIQKLANSTILTDEDWINFKRMFNAVHKDFFQKLTTLFPQLTVSEIRLLALIKLNLSNVEIASVIGVSIFSVRKTSLRLRKKLNIVAHSDLFEFVESL